MGMKEPMNIDTTPPTQTLISATGHGHYSSFFVDVDVDVDVVVHNNTTSRLRPFIHSTTPFSFFGWMFLVSMVCGRTIPHTHTFVIRWINEHAKEA